MNLVKAQAVANDLPISELQKYANGFNPSMIPPWVAAGVMQEKMATQQKLANMQGAAQGEQPSVKEQIEQKAGLMALQQQMKQQSQGGIPPMGSMPVPEGTPQPEPQPEAFMAASGGLARLPVQFGFNGGGIVAFAEGGSSGKYETAYDRRNRLNAEAAAEEAKKPLDAAAQAELEQAKGDAEAMKDTLRRLAYAGYDIATLVPRGLAGAFETAVTRPLRAVGVDVPYLPESFYGGDRTSMTPYYDKIRREDAAKEGNAPRSMADERARNMAIVNQQPRGAMANDPRLLGATPTAETVVSASEMGRGTGKAGPQGVPAGLPGALAAGKPQTSPLQAEALQAARAIPTTAPTPEETIAQSNKLLPGVASEEAQKALYARQQQRYDDLMAQYEKSKPSGLDDLIRVFGQAGQYKGLSGLGPAYTANKESQRLQDLTFANKLNALRAEAEKEEQTGARDLYGKRADLFGKQTEQFGQNVRAKAQDLAQLYNVDQGAINTMLTNATHMATARINADQKLNVLTPSQKAEIVNKAIDNVANELKGNPALMAQSMKDPGLRQRLVNQQVELLMKAAGGTTMAGAPGASGPGGTTPPPGAVREVKR